MLRSDTFNPAIRVKNAPEGRVDVEVMGTLRIVLETWNLLASFAMNNVMFLLTFLSVSWTKMQIIQT